MPRPVHAARRASLLAVLGTALAVLLGLLTATPAQAANYQYWGYYQLVDGKWVYAQTAPAQTNPADGSVEGWRWAITEESGTPPRNPRVTPAFNNVCGSTPAAAGQKRVAVVIDYGRNVDASADGTTTPPQPETKCATVDASATGADVLGAVAKVRTEGGLVCGINEYPASGCGGAVTTLTEEQTAADTPVTLLGAAAPTATPGAGSATPTETAGPVVAPANTSTTSSGVPAVVWVGLVILLLGVAALVWSAMRRRRQNV